MFQLSSGDIKKERMFLTGGQGVAGSNPVIPTNKHRAAFESPFSLVRYH